MSSKKSIKDTEMLSSDDYESGIEEEEEKEADFSSEDSESEFDEGSDEEEHVVMKTRESKTKSYKEYSDDYDELQDEELSASELSEVGVDEEEEEEESDELSVQTILGKKDVLEKDENEDVYYVKFQNRSYIHCQWLTQSELMELENGEQALAKFEKRLNKVSLSSSISIDNLLVFEDQEINSVWFEVDRVLDEGENAEGEKTYLVKWKSIDYDEATWEKECDIKEKSKITEYKERINNSNPINIPSRWKHPEPSEYKEMKEFPKSKNGFSLRDYQVEGVNWLRRCWYNKMNNILADEMGLGKTAQIVSLLNNLYLTEGVRGPFLVVAPLSTLPHWRNEFENWSNLNAIIYHGNSDCRTLIKKLEFEVYNDKGNLVPGRVQFDVVVTNNETILQDFSVFKDIQWRYVVFDEAHKLKNPNGKLYQCIETMFFEQCTLLTGTPIQNRMEELWGLLHLLHPEKFDDLKEFSRKFGNMKDQNQVKEIQAIIKPIMLRRKKSDVEKSLAPKEETIVDVELTRVQKKFYKAFLHENAGTLLHQITGGALTSLQNLMMQLRKVCNHPYLIKGAEDAIIEEKRKEPAYQGLTDEEVELKAMVESSGKLVFIDKLLPKLKEGGHKILIFSQMVRILQIIESFLIAKDYKYELIDGTVSENERAAAIDRFNLEPDVFVFLLSTRAGGVGINLTAADTVIIYDSDWNPQNDLQAEARCHRIGQTQKVKIYRLITRNTYESKMFERSSRKLGLDHVVLDGGDMGNERSMKANEIEEMLRNGIQSLFKEDDSKADEFTSEDIDQILSRRAKVTTTDVISGGGSVFSKATFNADGDDLDMNSTDFWQKVLPKEFGTNDDSIHRRKRRRMNKDETEGTLSVNTIMSNLTSRGFTNKPGEASILRQAYAFYKGSSPGDVAALNIVLNSIVIDESEIEIERGLGENAVKIESRAEKIINRTAYFYRLRRALYLIQDNEIKWPVISPPWEDPVSEYGLMVGVCKYGLHTSDLDELPTDKELGLTNKKSLTPAATEKRIHNLVKAFEEQFEDKLNDPLPSEYKFLPPNDWKEKHPGVLARTYLYDNEVIVLFQTLCAIGKPIKDNEIDWEKIRDAAKLNIITTSAIQKIGQQIFDMSESDKTNEPNEGEEGETKSNDDKYVDFQAYTELKPLQGNITHKDMRKLSLTIKEMAKVYKFISKLGPKRLEIMKDAPATNGVPSWWSWEHDNALINNLAKYGTNVCVTWIADKEGPFYEHIPKDLLPQYEEAAKKEASRGRIVKPQEQGDDFLFIFRERSRIARALSVISFVSKQLSKMQDEDGQGEGKKTRRRSKKNDITDEGVILKVNPSLKILSFGKIVLTNGFLTKNMVYPLGYMSYRRYKLKGTNCPQYWYRCEIAEENNRPVFRVETVDRPDKKCYESDNPSTVWSMVADELAAQIGEKTQKVVGTWMFGLNSKEVHQELLKLPDGDKVPFLQPKEVKKAETRQAPTLDSFLMQFRSPKKQVVSAAQLPAQVVQASAPTFQLPTPAVQIPAPTFQLPTPDVQVPAPTIQVQAPVIQVPSLTVHPMSIPASEEKKEETSVETTKN